MNLDVAQLQALRTDITVTRASVVYQGQTLRQWWDAGDDTMLANFYVQLATPPYYVWRTSVMFGSLMQGDGFDWTRVDNLTVGKSRIVEFMIAASPVNFTLETVREGVEAAFSVESGDQACRQALYNGGSRQANYGEQLYATGAGTAPSHHGVGPAAPTVEGEITATDVGQSRSA